MRVAFFASIGSPDVGGGYRFQYEVASKLLSGAPLRHEFHVIVDSDAAADAWGGTTERVIDVRRSVVKRGAHRARRLVVEGARERFRGGQWWEGSRSFEPYFRGQLARRNIGALLSLQPGVVPSFSVPFVTLVWDLQHRLQPIFPEVSANGEWEAREAAYRSILPRASAVVTGTQRGSAEIQRFYGLAAESVYVVPFPTPEFARTATATAAPRPAGLPARYLFYPAQFWPHKNHVVLLHALTLLRDKALGNRDMFLLFVGSDKGVRGHVEQMAKELGVSDRVTFEGFVSQERLVELYRHAEALVFPSYFGPDNLPPLEAFAIGTPVIAARVPGADDQLGDAALLADPRVAGEWAEAIRRVLDEPGLRRSLVQKGIERSASRTLAHYVEGLCAVFDKIEPVRACWPR